MSTTERLATIHEGIAAGLSRRAIARSLGISDKTVRTILRTADTAPIPAAATADYIPPGPFRVLPPAVESGGLSVLPSSPTKAFIRCPGCSHAAWRTAPGRQEWECGCVVGPHGCHGPALVADEFGIQQITWLPFLIRRTGAPFVG